MTFLEALNWMSKSEENISVYNEGRYKVIGGGLYLELESYGKWVLTNAPFNDFNFREWSKSEPAPEEVELECCRCNNPSVNAESVEVVAYMDTQDKEIRFMVPGSKFEKELTFLGDRLNTEWRKVRVKWGEK